jgi:hypothetical protein
MSILVKIETRINITGAENESGNEITDSTGVSCDLCYGRRGESETECTLGLFRSLITLCGAHRCNRSLFLINYSIFLNKKYILVL